MNPNEKLPDTLQIGENTYVRTGQTEDLFALDYLITHGGVELFVRRTSLDPPTFIYALNEYGDGLEYRLVEKKEAELEEASDISHLRETLILSVQKYPQIDKTIKRCYAIKRRASGTHSTRSYSLKPGRLGRLVDFVPDISTIFISVDRDEDKDPIGRLAEERLKGIEPIVTKRWRIYFLERRGELCLIFFPNVAQKEFGSSVIH